MGTPVPPRSRAGAADCVVRHPAMNESVRRAISSIHRELKCSICHSLINEAQSLPCLHIFCKVTRVAVVSWRTASDTPRPSDSNASTA